MGEAKFVIFDKDFNKLNEYFDNSLKYRAISIFFSQEKITWVTNDPMKVPRYIHCIGKQKKLN